MEVNLLKTLKLWRKYLLMKHSRSKELTTLSNRLWKSPLDAAIFKLFVMLSKLKHKLPLLL